MFRAVYRGRLAAVALSALSIALSLSVAAAGDTLPEGSQAAKGREVYAAHCAQCHGEQGEGFIGPAVIGQGALVQYDTAQRLFEYVAAAMPQNNPGGLTEQQYLQVVTYLLVGNDVIAPTASPARDKLAGISIEKSR